MARNPAQILRAAGAALNQRATDVEVLDAAVDLYWRKRFPGHRRGRFLVVRRGGTR